MAIFKCKMCGGSLEIIESTTVCECEYCGTQQTLPKNHDEVVANLFNRANNLRSKCEFDKAQEIYEKIVTNNPTEAEAYWGVILCKFGIEYVEDPATFKKVPTCHRTQLESVQSDVDYQSALEHADAVQRSIYEREAAEIDRMQKEILSIVRNEKPFDVFICYKESDETGKRTQDSVIANDIYHQLTQEGFKVFYAAITLEDKLGQAYEPYIFAALNSAKVMLVIGTKPEHFNAVWVKNEWSRYLKINKNDRSKLLIPCYRDMNAYDLPDEFSYLQAQDMSKIGFINDVIRGIKKILVKEQKTTENQTGADADYFRNATRECAVQDGVYMGNLIAGKPHGFGTAIYSDGRKYEGNWNVGKKHGQGVMYYPDGRKFEGEYKDDEIYKGKGFVTYKNGDEYDGEFSDGKRHGKGVCYYKNGDKYDGTWVNGKKSGKGIYYFSNGDKYEGEFADGVKNGQGILYFANGGIFEGEFKNDVQYAGSGRETYSNGDAYEGSIKNGERHGQGVYFYKNGNKYEGEFVNGLRSGKGVMYYSDGGRFEGVFKNDVEYSGVGKVGLSGGETYEGEVKDGKWHGQGVYFYKDGSKYEGAWLKGKRNGAGVMYWADGSKFEGIYKDGQKYTGSGMIKCKNGTYEGEIRNGKFHGHGVRIYTSGTQYEGGWKNGFYNGHGTLCYDDEEKFEGVFNEGQARTGTGTIRFQDESKYTGKLKKGQKRGKGQLTLSDGTTYTGKWKKNKMIGRFVIQSSDGTIKRGIYDKAEKFIEAAFIWRSVIASFSIIVISAIFSLLILNPSWHMPFNFKSIAMNGFGGLLVFGITLLVFTSIIAIICRIFELFWPKAFVLLIDGIGLFVSVIYYYVFNNSNNPDQISAMGCFISFGLVAAFMYVLYLIFSKISDDL